MFLKVATEMPFPEDTMKERTVPIEKVPLEDAPRTRGGGPPRGAPTHAALSVEDARRSRPPTASCSRLVGPAEGPVADWLRRWAEVMLLSLASRAPGKP